MRRHDTPMEESLSLGSKSFGLSPKGLFLEGPDILDARKKILSCRTEGSHDCRSPRSVQEQEGWIDCPILHPRVSDDEISRPNVKSQRPASSVCSSSFRIRSICTRHRPILPWRLSTWCSPAYPGPGWGDERDRSPILPFLCLYCRVPGEIACRRVETQDRSSLSWREAHPIPVLVLQGGKISADQEA